MDEKKKAHKGLAPSLVNPCGSVSDTERWRPGAAFGEEAGDTRFVAI